MSRDAVSIYPISVIRFSKFLKGVAQERDAHQPHTTATMFPEALLNTLLLALVLAANPASAAFNMPLTKHINTVNAQDILARDQARASYLATGKRKSFPQVVDNQATHYTAEVGVGTPPTNCTPRRFNYLKYY